MDCLQPEAYAMAAVKADQLMRDPLVQQQVLRIHGVVIEARNQVARLEARRLQSSGERRYYTW